MRRKPPPKEPSLRVLGERETYLIAKAMAIAVAFLNHERPYRQSDDIKDMNKILKLTGEFGRLASSLFEKELEVIERASDVIQTESARCWSNGVEKPLTRRLRIVKMFEPPRKGTADEE